MRHVIRAKPISISGIAIRGEHDGMDDLTSQVSCVVGLSRNKNGQKSAPSLPIRNTKAKWSSARDTTGHSDGLSLETTLDKKQTNKTFEVSIMLNRGNEQILIGVASLTFLSALMETVVEIPIYAIGSDDAVEISNRAKTRSKKSFLGGEQVHDSFFQSNPFVLVDGVHAVSFLGGDCERLYYLEKNACVRLKCACLPTRYEHLLLQFQSLIIKQSQSCLGPSGLGSASGQTFSFSTNSPQKSYSNVSRRESSPSTSSSKSRSNKSTYIARTGSNKSTSTSSTASNSHQSLSLSCASSDSYQSSRDTSILTPLYSSFDDTAQSGMYSQPSSSVTFSFSLQPDVSFADSINLKALYHHLGKTMTDADSDVRSPRHKIGAIMDSHIGRSLQKIMLEMKKGFLSMNKLGIGGFEQLLRSSSYFDSVDSLALTTTASSSLGEDQFSEKTDYTFHSEDNVGYSVPHFMPTEYRNILNREQSVGSLTCSSGGSLNTREVNFGYDHFPESLNSYLCPNYSYYSSINENRDSPINENKHSLINENRHSPINENRCPPWNGDFYEQQFQGHYRGHD